MVCFRYIIKNTLYKGNNKNDDDDDDNSLCLILTFSAIILFEKTDRSTTEIQQGLYWKKWTGKVLCRDPRCILQVTKTSNAVLYILSDHLHEDSNPNHILV